MCVWPLERQFWFPGAFGWETVKFICIDLNLLAWASVPFLDLCPCELSFDHDDGQHTWSLNTFAFLLALLVWKQPSCWYGLTILCGQQETQSIWKLWAVLAPLQFIPLPSHCHNVPVALWQARFQDIIPDKPLNMCTLPLLEQLCSPGMTLTYISLL